MSAPTVEVSATGPATKYTFLLTPHYSMIALANAIESLRMANRMSAKTLYEWRTVTLDGNPVNASNGLNLSINGALSDIDKPDILFVCGGVDIAEVVSDELVAALKTASQSGIQLGAMCTGTYVLAKAQLLNGYRCTIHWENIAALREEFPEAVISAGLFEIDRDRFTCAGGTASIDMMLNLIRETHGQELVTVIAEEFVRERIRGRNDRQRVPLRHQLGTSQPKLVEAVSLMESNIEEPMSLDELAHHVGLSRRQLERLFQKHLSCVPTRYYLELRLRRARELLLQTSKSIVDIAFACGFVSAPHFSKCYRDFFGIPPRDERRLAEPEMKPQPQVVQNPAQPGTSI